MKSLEIEEKINKIRWLNRRNQAHFLLSTNGKFNCFVIDRILFNLCLFYIMKKAVRLLLMQFIVASSPD